MATSTRHANHSRVQTVHYNRQMRSLKILKQTNKSTVLGKLIVSLRIWNRIIWPQTAVYASHTADVISITIAIKHTKQ